MMLPKSLVVGLFVTTLGSSGIAAPVVGTEQQALETYQQVRKLIREKAYLGPPAKQLAAIKPQLGTSLDPATRAASYHAATQAIFSLLKKTDRWAMIEEAQANAARITPNANNVTSHRLPGDVGIVKIRRFRGPVGKQLETAIADLKKAGPIKGLLLDLRDNGGGLISEAVAVLSQLLPGGDTYFSQRYGTPGSPYQVVPAVSNPQYKPDLATPLALLVDEGTASSSEITTGVLKDYRRARVFGSPTYGKGVGQLGHMLPDGRRFQQTELVLELPITGTYHGRPLQPDESSEEAKERLRKDGRVRPRGDELMRGALVFLWDQQGR